MASKVTLGNKEWFDKEQIGIKHLLKLFICIITNKFQQQESKP